MCGDEEVVGANHRAALLQVGADHRVVDRRLVVQAECIDVGRDEDVDDHPDLARLDDSKTG